MSIFLLYGRVAATAAGSRYNMQSKPTHALDTHTEIFYIIKSSA